jgi:transposase
MALFSKYCEQSAPKNVLYFPAIVATRKNPDVKALYERLLAADKTKMCALGAAMRKLVHICYGVVKNQAPYTAQSIPS